MMDQLSLTLPLARNSDPSTSGEAAAVVAAGAPEHERLIVRILEREGPLTHEEIVGHVNAAMPGRWLAGSTVSACGRLHLFEWCKARNARGRSVVVWSLTKREDGAS